MTKLLQCGVLAGPLFTLAYLVEGATRAGYDPLRHPVSSLALGDQGWTQTANFLLTGVLTIAFAVGARSVLIGLWGIGLIGAGIFVTDPLSGYPPGTPDLLVQHTTAGTLHDLFSLLAFAALPIAFVVYAIRFGKQRRIGWAAYSIVTAVLFVVTFVLASAGFSQSASLVDVAGLFQRICVTIGWIWITLFAIDTIRKANAAPTVIAAA